MGDKFIWKEEYNIGVDTIDQEHQRLFKIINRLFAFQEEEKDSQWACQEGIKFFKGHTMKHFADEEAYMESIGYKGLEQHRRIHQSFRTNTLPALEQELEQTGYSQEAMEHFLGVCAGWLIGHTLTEEDLKINDNLRASWMEDEEMDIAMEDGLVFSGRLSGTIPGCGYGGGHSSFSVTGISGGKLRQEKARVKTPWRLAAGDTVLLIPDRERQFFYLVMKVVDYGAVPLNRAPRPAR